MDESIKNLKTPEECLKLANSIRDLYPELAREAHRRAIELRAIAYGSKSEVETELLKALFAYEDVLSEKNNRKTRASRTWQMINRYGIIGAAEKAVNRKIEAIGYLVLSKKGMKDWTFESVIVRYPKAFRHEVVAKAKLRLEEFSKF